MTAEDTVVLENPVDVNGPPEPPFDVGDPVHVVCWHPEPEPGNDNAGTWEVVTGRIVGIGKMVCFETSNPTLLFGGTVDPIYGSPLRFTTPDLVFTTDKQAVKYAATLKRPY